MQISNPNKIANQKLRDAFVIRGYNESFTNAQKLAEKHHYELISISEFIKWLKDPNTYKKFGGFGYWTRDLNIGASKYCRIDYSDYKLEPVTKKEFYKLSIEQKALVRTGDKPILVHISAGGSERLIVVANGNPEQKNRIVVVKKFGENPLATLNKGVILNFIREGELFILNGVSEMDIVRR